MEGVGLFTIAKYRKCSATAIYIISDVISERNWELGWDEGNLDTSAAMLIDTMIGTVTKEK